MTRIRRVESRRELEKLTDEFVTKGYKIENRGEQSARVKDKDLGSAPVHGFVFLFALIGAAVLVDAAGITSSAAWVVAFLANALYGFYSWWTSEQVLIKIEDEQR